MEIKPVAVFRSPLKEKFGTPRQAGLAPSLRGEIVFGEGYSPGMLDGLQDFDYLWLVWGFDRNGSGGGAKVRPPRLGGNRKCGVYATRSPYRPNPLGLSSVRIESVDAAAGIIRVLGADLVDGTPIYDVKPYVVYADSHPEARSGFVDEVPWEPLEVHFPSGTAPLEERDAAGLREILSQDPRPRYQNDPERIYGLAYKNFNVRFRVRERTLEVLSVEPV